MDQLLHHSIDRAAQNAPDSEAFRCHGKALSYHELLEGSNRLANLLISEGTQIGDRVGIYMNKGLELPVALYGILKAGAAYVPIDPSAPPERIAFILENCGITHLITNDSRSRQALDLTGKRLACLVGAKEKNAETTVYLWEDLDQFDTTAPDLALTGSDLAYIMYTSGSTGVPKGLMHTHASGLAYAQMSAKTYGVQASDRLGNHSPLHFDMSTFEYLTGPYCGATTVIIPEEATMFPVSLTTLVESERLTFWYSVPLALIQMLELGNLENCDTSSLRWILFGGEPFPPKHLRRLMELCPSAHMSNSYGPAEVNQCTHQHILAGHEIDDHPIPLGQIWEGAEGLVLDTNDHPVADGAQGELVVHTPTMMQGYWRRPDLNDKAFFRTNESGGEKTYYRTGDLVQENDQGLLTFLGRKDRQIKIRGFRVELEEVENVLNNFPEIREAAVIANSDKDGQKMILAMVQLTGKHKCEAQDLLTRAAGHLSSYAVPSRLEFTTTFPRTGSGKIDRNAVADLLA